MQAILKILEIIWSYSMDDECTIETFKVISQSGGGGGGMFRYTEESYWDFTEVDKFICLIPYYQINLGNNVFRILLDNGNEYNEKLPVKEDLDRNSLLVIDSSINETVKLR